MGNKWASEYFRCFCALNPRSSRPNQRQKLWTLLLRKANRAKVAAHTFRRLVSLGSHLNWPASMLAHHVAQHKKYSLSEFYGGQSCFGSRRNTYCRLITIAYLNKQRKSLSEMRRSDAHTQAVRRNLMLPSHVCRSKSFARLAPLVYCVLPDYYCTAVIVCTEPSVYVHFCSNFDVSDVISEIRRFLVGNASELIQFAARVCRGRARN